MSRHHHALASIACLLVALMLPAMANAVSQWSRKYGVSCTTCHTAAFPRLNYTGEQFQRNGYQDVGTQDGDDTGKQKIGDKLFIDELGNLLGVRLNVTALRVATNSLQEAPGSGPESYATSVDIGNPNWLQLFTAGSVFKNVSIFIETEIPFDGKVHNSWFRFGFHNLFGSEAINAWVGNLDPLELHAASGRLPMLPPVRQEVFLVKSSNGKGDESVDLRNARPGIAVFGSAGRLVYEIGIDNGPNQKDSNEAKNVWGTLRAYVATEGPFEGSSVSLWGNWGRDSKISKDLSGNFVSQADNDFWRVSPAANLRWNDLDVLAAWVYGEDDNWLLAAQGSPSTRNIFRGLMFQAGHPLGKDYHVALQYDRIWSSDTPALEVDKIALAFSWQLRENWRVMLVPRVDILSESATHPRQSHELQLVIRTMF